jgi:hypothetical protein
MANDWITSDMVPTTIEPQKTTLVKNKLRQFGIESLIVVVV